MFDKNFFIYCVLVSIGFGLLALAERRKNKK
jgi:hypothetical protein